MFSPEFTGQRAQIISHDHTHHLECVIVSTKHLLQVYFLAQLAKLYIQSPDSFFLSSSSSSGCFKNMLVLRWNQRGTLGAPKGTVPFGKGLVSTLAELEVNVMKICYLQKAVLT